MNFNPVTLQSLASELGEHRALRSCLPVSFYATLQATGYLDPNANPADFCRELTSNQALFTDKFYKQDWSRPAVSGYLRQKYHVPIVSWQLKGPNPPNIELMKKSGYLQTEEEVNFFRKEILGRNIPEIVQKGYPVIVTMKPGFGGTGSDNIHAAVIVSWTAEGVRVFDPDARNSKVMFDPGSVFESIFLDGAGTVVLPKGLNA